MRVLQVLVVAHNIVLIVNLSVLPSKLAALPAHTRPRIRKAVCIVSGGLDSVCTAAYLREEGYSVYMLTFAYGQRARYEIQASKTFRKDFED